MTDTPAPELSPETWKAIDSLVARVARKAGYTAADGNWNSYLQRQLAFEAHKVERKLKYKAGRFEYKARNFDRRAREFDRRYGGNSGQGFRDAAEQMRASAMDMSAQAVKAAADVLGSAGPQGRPNLEDSFVDQDFAEEIRTYIADSIRDKMADGLSEADALTATEQQFDDADGAPDFTSFLGEFAGFGIDALRGEAMSTAARYEHEYEYGDDADWGGKRGEALGLFYAAFLFLGITVGGLLGFLLGHGAHDIFIGLGIGTMFGLTGGFFSHAILALKGNKKGQ